MHSLLHHWIQKSFSNFLQH